jgi:hypothetical protein
VGRRNPLSRTRPTHRSRYPLLRFARATASSAWPASTSIHKERYAKLRGRFLRVRDAEVIGHLVEFFLDRRLVQAGFT